MELYPVQNAAALGLGLSGFVGGMGESFVGGQDSIEEERASLRRDPLRVAEMAVGADADTTVRSGFVRIAQAQLGVGGVLNQAGAV